MVETISSFKKSSVQEAIVQANNPAYKYFFIFFLFIIKNQVLPPKQNYELCTYYLFDHQYGCWHPNLSHHQD